MDCERPSFEAGDAQRAAQGGDASGLAQELEADILAELTEFRGILMGFARDLAEQAAEKPGPEALAKLNNATVKTARAFRQVAVLQLEMIGKRQPASQRGATKAPAEPEERLSPEEAEERSQRERFPDGMPYERGDYDDYDDYTDEERVERSVRKLFVRGGLLVAAMDADFRAAGRADIVRHESVVTKHKLICYIPHPNLDRVIAEADPRIVLLGYLEMGRLPPVAGTGPPEEWDAYNENCRIRDLHKPEVLPFNAHPRPE